MNKLSNILFSRYRAKKLASFYILRDCSSAKGQSIREEYEYFISKILQRETHANNDEAAKRIIKLGHPDLLTLTPAEKAKEYAQIDFIDFFRFQNFSNIELSHRFVLVTNAQLINDRLGNKLLKTLEEPQEKTTIFFIVPQGHLTLATINSRAITLTYRDSASIPPSTNFSSFSDWLQHKDNISELQNNLSTFMLQNGPIQELLTQLKGKQILQDELCKSLIEWQLINQGDYHSKTSFLKTLKYYDESRAFRNPPNERLFQLLHNVKSTLQNCQK